MAESTVPFYVRRETKTCRISKSRLLKLHQQGKLRSHDEIRMSGTPDWIRENSVDWERLGEQSELVELVTQELPPSSKANPDRSAVDEQETMSFVQRTGVKDTPPAEQKSPADPSPFDQAKEKPLDWWNDSSRDRPTPTQVFPIRWAALSIVSLLGLIGGSTALFVAFPDAKIEYSNDDRRLAAESAPATDHSEGSDQVEDLGVVGSEGVASEVGEFTETTQADTVEPVADPPEPLPPASKRRLAQTGETDRDRTGEQSDAANSMLAESQADATDHPVEPPMSSKVPASDDAQGKDVLKLERPEYARPSPIELAFRKTANTMKLHRETCARLVQKSDEIRKLETAIRRLQLEIQEQGVQLEVLPRQLANIEAQIDQNKFELMKGYLGREHLVPRQKQLIASHTEGKAKFLEISRALPSKRELLKNSVGAQAVLKGECSVLIGAEAESRNDLMIEIDFFGELPADYHRRVLEQTEIELAGNPSFLLGYILHGLSSAHLGNHAIVRADAQKLKQEIRRLGAYAIRGRMEMLKRYVAMSDFMVANADLIVGNVESARKAIQSTGRLDPSFVEGWLMKGIVEARLAKTVDAWGSFDRAVRLQKDSSPRTFRIAIRELCGLSDMPQQKMENYLNALEDTGSDWRSYYELSRAHLVLRDRSTAIGYFKRIRPTEMNRHVLGQLASKLGLPAPSAGD